MYVIKNLNNEYLKYIEYKGISSVIKYSIWVESIEKATVKNTVPAWAACKGILKRVKYVES